MAGGYSEHDKSSDSGEMPSHQEDRATRPKHGRRSVFIDDECECSDGSCDESNDTVSCDSHASFIVDDSIDNADEYVAHLSPHDSGLNTEEIDSCKLDTELSVIQKQVNILNETEKLMLLISISLDLNKMDAKLSRVTLPTHISAFGKSTVLSAFANKYIPGLKGVHNQTWESVISLEWATRKAMSNSTLTMLRDLRNAIAAYINQDILMCTECTEDDCDTVKRDIGTLFRDINVDSISRWRQRSRNVVEDSVTVPLKRQRVMLNRCSTPEYGDRIETLESFSMPMEEYVDSEMDSMNDRSAPLITRATKTSEGDFELSAYVQGSCEDEYIKWMAIPRFKSYIQECRKTVGNSAFDAKIVLDILHRYYCKILTECRCSSKAATRGAVDVLAAYISAATYNSVCETSRNYAAVDTTPSSQVTVSTNLKAFPTDDIIHEVLLWKASDARFMALDAGWRYREYSTLGVFESVPQPQANKKHVYMCIYGNTHATHFHDSVESFMTFTATHIFVSKTGIYASQTRTRCVVNNEQVTQLMHVILTMSRATSLLLISQQLVFYLESVNIPRSNVMIAAFNNDDDFKTVYTEVESLRKTAPESGFIGPPDSKLRQKLGCNADSTQDPQLFRAVFEALRRNGVKTQAQAVEYITRRLYDTDDSEEKKVFESIMQSGHAATMNLKSALWWNDMMAKRKHDFTKSELGRVTMKIVNKFYQDIKQLFGGHLLNPLVDIDDWDEEIMGPMKLKGTLFQPAIWKLVTQYREASTDLLTVLKGNGITPVTFFNCYFRSIVLQIRRQKTIVLSGCMLTGKSITAGCIMNLHDGKRLAPDNISSGNSFVIDSVSDPNSDVGVVIIEDASERALKRIDMTLRPQLDGDLHTINLKYKDVAHGTWPGVIITTNLDADSDSDVDTKTQKRTMRTREILKQRGTVLKMKTQLPHICETLGIEKQIESIHENDLICMYWRYTLFPICNAIYANSPRCAFSPCKSEFYEDHHPMCPLVREIHANLKLSSKFTLKETKPSSDNKTKSTLHETYERIESDALGAVFDINHVDDVRSCLKLLYNVSELDITYITDAAQLQEMQVKVSEIDHFVDKVWTPLCYLSSYMCGKFATLKKKSFPWAHNYVMENDWYAPISSDDNTPWTMADLVETNFGCTGQMFRKYTHTVDDINHMIKAQYTSHPRIGLWSIIPPVDDTDANHFTHLLQSDMNRIVMGVRKYINATAKQKRWTKYDRGLQTLFTNCGSDAKEFSELWLQLIGQPKRVVARSVVCTPTKVTRVDPRFYD